MTSLACPCGAGLFASCCGPYLAGDVLPPTAVDLMRSRYTAYVREDYAYVRATWHASTRPAALANEPGGHWLGLRVVHHQLGGAHDSAGEVEFVARYKVGGRAHRLHERSRFVKEGGRWYYLGRSESEPAPATSARKRR